MAFPDSSEVAQAIESTESAAPESSSEAAPQTAGGSDLAPDSNLTPAQLTEIEKLEKFKFEGREWTPNELKQAYLRQQDYTRKTQEFAQERKFYDNLSIDLKNVRNNPALASEFRKVYPEKFHQYLEHLSLDSGKTAAPQPETRGSQPSYANLDPEVVKRFERIESYVNEKEVSTIESQLETQEKEMMAKYKMADLETVYARAETALKEGVKLTPEVWEKLYKADHDKNQKRYEAVYKETIQKQKQAGLRGKDMASGGGMPGSAPKTYRSIKEATQAALDDLDS